jgi:UDP-N-acetylmuramoyl-tripeptide--D-alanyl-D-alanine ligase
VYEALSEDGVAIINHDDVYAPLWRELAAGRRVVSFGFSPGADFHPAADSLRQSQDGSWQFRLSSPVGQIDLALSLPGRHNVANALAAAAAAVSVGAKLSDTRTGLRQVPATAGRLIATPGWNGSRLIDDSYNANPQSLNAAIEFTVSLGGRSWLALGDMGELGEAAERLHRDGGLKARALGIERLFALGVHSRHAVDAFGSGARWFDESGALVRELQNELTADVTLLVKGSRSMHMERVVEPLKSQPAIERAANGDH